MRIAVLLAVALAGHCHAFELVVGLPQRNLDQLERAFWDISTPGSPTYLQHMSTSALAKMIGASAGDVQVVKQWLFSLGASSVDVSSIRDVITASFPGRHGTLPPTSSHPTKLDYVLLRSSHRSSHGGLHDYSDPSDEASFGYSIAAQKKAYGIPEDLAASSGKALQMVWGPGTFGYSVTGLAQFKVEECPLLNLSRVHFDTKNHGTPGGDNYGEGNLDTRMISAFGLNVHTIVSNTNTSSSTEEGNGFGQALLDFLTSLASRDVIPHVLSMSLGSLSSYSCDLLCVEAVKLGHSKQDCEAYLQQQRQVCMFLSQEQTERISVALKVLGTRGVSIFAASGDGGSHFSFQPFEGGALADDLNKISCEFQMPVFPTASPYVTSVGGTVWEGDGTHPKAWGGSGGGFSWQFAAPSHQTTLVGEYLKSAQLPPFSSFNASGRAYPDVAAVSVDGTSQSSPTVAGIFGLLTDLRLSKGLPPLGYLGPRLWQVSASSPGEAFEDIEDGNTKTSCASGFAGTKGWDPVTGFGRPRWEGLVKHFASD